MYLDLQNWILDPNGQENPNNRLVDKDGIFMTDITLDMAEGMAQEITERSMKMRNEENLKLSESALEFIPIDCMKDGSYGVALDNLSLLIYKLLQQFKETHLTTDFEVKNAQEISQNKNLKRGKSKDFDKDAYNRMRSKRCRTTSLKKRALKLRNGKKFLLTVHSRSTSKDYGNY